MFRTVRVLLQNGRSANPVWLFSENLGATASNNSFFMWKHIVARHADAVSPYLLLEPSARNRLSVAGLSPQERKFVVWRHSLLHAILYLRAEFAFVSLSFRDVWPESIRILGFTKSFKPVKRCSLIYLQHGTLGIKALGYGPGYADGTMLRFVHYNPKIRDALVTVNGFRPYQLYYATYHPRYQELVRRRDGVRKGGGKRILWFLTWREYMGKNISTYKFFRRIADVLASDELNEYLERKDGILTVCLHQLCSSKCAQYMPMVESACSSRIKLVYAAQLDVMDEIASSDLLITDYSSLGFDFTFLRKPVILYAQDFALYRRGRSFYCSDEEYSDVAVFTKEDLLRRLTRDDYPALNPFFAARMEVPDKEVYARVRNGDYIERMYDYFYSLQNATYAFTGYDFSGVGGTVYATKALAEGLLEAGKRVLFVPLKNGAVGAYPAGVVNRPMIDYAHSSRLERLRRRFIGRQKDYSYLVHDKDMPNLRPYCGYALTRLMRTIRAKAVISTRETMHYFVDDATSPWIRERYYYFHCHADLVDKLFPGTIERLKARSLETALFVTAGNRDLLKKNFNYVQYCRAIVTGNALDSSRMIECRRICPVEEKACYRVAYLLRLSPERWCDVERALQFARYLKAKNNTRIKINVYGKGDQALRLQYLLVDEELDEFMSYCGETRDIVKTFAQHDAMVDFSRFQSFGMGYIEAVFNGRMPFCRHNEGADEVLHDLPNCFFETDEELEQKILTLPALTTEDLWRNYETLAKRYSRTAVASAILSGQR